VSGIRDDTVRYLFINNLSDIVNSYMYLLADDTTIFKIITNELDQEVL
jgi:hypothetical protein